MFRRFFPWVVLALTLTAPAAVHGQALPGLEQPASATAGEGKPAEPVAIEPAQVPARADQAQETLRRANEIAEPLGPDEAISPRLPGMAMTISSMLADPALGDPVGMDFRSLENAEQQWTNVRATLNDWQTRLTARSTTLSEWRSRADREIRIWDLTITKLKESGVTGAPVETAAGIRNAWREADQRLTARQGEVLTVQSELTSQLEVAGSMLERIVKVRSEVRLGVLKPDHQPLWRGTRPLERTRELPSVQERLARDVEVARAYVNTKGATLAVHLLLTIAGIVLFVSIRKRVGRVAEHREDLARPLAIFRRPVAVALASSLMVFPWVYPGAPPAFRELVGLCALIPIVVLLPLVIPKSMRRPVYAVAGLFLLVRLTDLLSSGTTVGRIVLLLYALAAGATAWWIFRPGGAAARLEGGVYWRVTRFVARVGAVLFVASAVLNVLGFVSLADLLAEGTLLSAFLGLLALLSVTVVEGIFTALLFSPVLQKLNMARWNGPLLLTWIVRVAAFAAALLWVRGTLRYFRVQEPFWNGLTSVLTASATIGTFSISLGDILGFAVALAAGLYVARFLRFVMNTEIFPRVTLPRGVPATIVMLINYAILGIAFVLAVAAAGIDLTKFALIAGALSVGIGFGLQNVVNNFVSGLILAFERPVQAGDAVQLGEMWGRVSRIGVRSSTVRTWGGAEVIVPNADLISNQVTNWTLSDQQRRVEIPAGVAYGTNPHKVIELLIGCAKAHPKVMPSREPQALFLGFGASSLDFELRCWTEDFDNFLETKSQLTLAIHDALYAAGIEIPFPQQDLHLRSVDAEAGARLAGRQPPGRGSGGADSCGSDGAGSPGGAGVPEAGDGGDGSGRGSG